MRGNRSSVSDVDRRKRVETAAVQESEKTAAGIAGFTHERARHLSLTTLLYVRLHEIFGVRLEHFVDFIEQIIEFGFQLLPRACGRGLGRRILRARRT
jgi:hypothetical protein